MPDGLDCFLEYHSFEGVFFEDGLAMRFGDFGTDYRISAPERP